MALLEHSENLKGKHIRIKRDLFTYEGVFLSIHKDGSPRWPGFNAILLEDLRPGDPTGTIRNGGFYLSPDCTVEGIGWSTCADCGGDFSDSDLFVTDVGNLCEVCKTRMIRERL